MRALASEPTPEADRLTAEQREGIRAVEEEFRAAMRTFQAEHKDELEVLRREAGVPTGPREAESPPADRGPARTPEAGRGAERARRAGGDAAPGNRRGRPDAEGEKARPRPANADRGGDPEARKRLAELMKTGPNPQEYQNRITALLTEPQRVLVRQRIDEAPAASPAPAAREGRGVSPPDRPRRGEQSGRRRGAPAVGGKPPAQRTRPPGDD